MQAAVPVLDDDTVESLAARILVEEHRIYPTAIQLVLDGGWTVEGRRMLRTTDATPHVASGDFSVSNATSGGQSKRIGT